MPVASYIRGMGDVINLRRARKAKRRTDADVSTAAQRAAHGRTKAEKKLSKAQRDAAARKLDGHKHDGHNHDERKHIERSRDASASDDE